MRGNGRDPPTQGQGPLRSAGARVGLQRPPPPARRAPLAICSPGCTPDEPSRAAQATREMKRLPIPCAFVRAPASALGTQRRISRSSGDQSQMQQTDVSQGVKDAAPRPGNCGLSFQAAVPAGADIRSAKLRPARLGAPTPSEPLAKAPRTNVQGLQSPTSPSPLLLSPSTSVVKNSHQPSKQKQSH